MCYDDTNYRAIEEEGCFGKTIGRNKGSITKISTETRVRATLEAHGKEGTRAHNS